MKTKTAKLTRDARIVVDEWHRKIGNRPFLIGLDCRQAMVAQCVMDLFLLRADAVESGEASGEAFEKGALRFAATYREACAALHVYLDPDMMV